MHRWSPLSKRSAAKLLATLLATVLFAASCSSSFSFSGDPAVRPSESAAESESGGSTPEAEPTEEPTGPLAEDEEAEPGGPSIDVRPRVEDEEATPRIAVQTSDGQLFTIQSDGSDRIDLTSPDDGTINQQPSWAPDASRIGWVSIDRRDGAAELRTDRFDLTGPTALAVDSQPFYLSWDPSSSQIAFLAPSVAGIDLSLASIGEEGEVKRLDRGEPYFFSWGPDGDELFVHASTFRLDRIDVDGATLVIEEFPAPFAAPVWLGDEQTLVYADQVAGENFFVTTGQLGEGRIELASFEGALTFSVNSTGIYAALISRQAPDANESGIITASFAAPAQDPTDEDPFADIVDELPLNTLGFIALYGGDLTTVSNDNVLAFYWDPTGEILAWLEPSDETPGMLQWWFSDRRDIWGGVEFTPTQTFANNYLPFFDQYAQSHTFFSPDGTEMTFAGQLADGQRGVFVMGTEPGAIPRRISDGVFAVWSPDSAGGGASIL